MSDYLRLKCYECGVIMRTVERQAGKRSRCPACGAPLRIPPQQVFASHCGKKVRAIREPEWDLRRVRAQREQARKAMLRTNQIESVKHLADDEESQELRASKPPTQPPLDPLPAETAEIIASRRAAAGNVSGGAQPGLAGTDKLGDGGVPAADGTPTNPLPRRGQAGPHRHTDTPRPMRTPAPPPAEGSRGDAGRRLGISGELLGLDEDELEEFFETHGAPSPQPSSSPSPSPQPADGLPVGGDSRAEAYDAMDNEVAALELDDSSDGDDGQDYNPSDLELASYMDSPGSSADFHTLLDDLADDDELDV